MNKSALCGRRNLNVPGLNSNIRKFSINEKNPKIKQQKDIEFHVQKKFSQFNSNMQLSQVENQQNPTLIKSFQQIPLLQSGSSAKVQKMIYQASQLYSSQINPFENSFVVQQKLGQGAHGVVKKCYHKQSKKVYAVKILKMQDEHFKSIKTNFINIKQLKNQHIIKYKALYLNSKKRMCYLVMEYLPYKRLQKYLEQTVLRIIFYKLITALAYMHQKCICHRDLKPDNILFDQNQRLLKIIDFGVSKNMKLRGKYEEMLTNTGQLYYRAPQMFLGGSYTQKVDSWAIGITLYQLIAGKTPFQDEYMIQTINNIHSKPLNFQHQNFKKYNKIVQDLISKLLQRDVKKRLSCKQAAKHFWFLPHLQNVDLMKSAGGNAFDYLNRFDLKQDLSISMGRGYSDCKRQEQGEKVTKGQKVVMKSWLEMINEDKKVNNEQYKFEFVQSQSQDDQHPFDQKSQKKEQKQSKTNTSMQNTSPLF